MNNDSKYLQFWSKMFGLTVEKLRKSQSEFVMSGDYIQKYGDRYIFQFEDFSTTKKIVAGANPQIATWDLPQIEAACNLAFDDVDFVLESADSFIATDSDPRVSRCDGWTNSISEFLAACSEDDRDTLDLSFEEEIVVALIEQGRVQAMARSVPIKETELCDVTMLVHPECRGRGLSTSVMSELVHQSLAEGFLPKYRVRKDHSSSIAVARRCGFIPRFHLQSWELKTNSVG